MSLFSNKLLLNLLASGLILSCPLQTMTAANSSSLKSPQSTKSAPDLEWKTYDFKESGFSIDFPKKPESVQQSIDIPKSNLKINYVTYLSEPSDNVVYVASVWKYPSQIDMSKPESNLKDGFSGMISALPGSEVKKMNMVDVDGFKALEFLVKNENIYFQGRLILVYNTLYQVFTVYKETENMSDNYKHFIDSFTLIDSEQNKVAPKNGTESNKVNV